MHGTPARAQGGRSPGAAAQLAAVHRTLRHGPVVQLQPGGAAACARPAAAPNAAGVNRTGLPDKLKQGTEALSGVALDDVRVHYNSPRPAALQAHAYAQGANIHVAPGQAQHLPHEAWHVVQQKQGRVKPTLQMMAGVPINDDVRLEREADAMGDLAARLHSGPAARVMQAVGRPRRADAGRPRLSALCAPPVQRVITFEQADKLGKTAYSPEELLDSVRGTREAGKFLKAYGDEETALLDFLRSFDDRTVASRNFIVNQIGSAAQKDPETERKRKAMAEAEAQHDRARAVRGTGWTERQASEVYLKLGLLRSVALGQEVDRFLNVLRQVLLQAEGGIIGRAGLMKTLATLTTIWPMAPEQYQDLGEKSPLSGLAITLMGLTGELDALYHASKRGRAAGETVFSGARYTDVKADVSEDVDVSFIDDKRVLHLIEVAGSFNVLHNKATDAKLGEQLPEKQKQTQKQRYQYLAIRSDTLVHETVDPLPGSQAEDQSVSDIRFSYSVPDRDFYDKVYSFKGREVVNALIKGGIGLNVGPKSYSPEELVGLYKHLEQTMAEAQQLTAMEPSEMQPAWQKLQGAPKDAVRAWVLNERAKFARVYHNIFHRQRRSAVGGLGGYAQM